MFIINNIKMLLLMSCVSVFFLSCSDSIDPYKQIFTKEVIVEWQGAYEVDGCGFFVVIDSIKYKPGNEEIFTDEFKNWGSKKTVLAFQYLKEDVLYGCGRGLQKEKGIKIISLQPVITYGDQK